MAQPAPSFDAKTARPLDVERAEFQRRRFLAMPLAGTIAWSLIGLGGVTLSPTLAVWALFILSGSIIYLGLFISRFTGEDFLAKDRPKNSFDGLFMLTVLQALLVFSIAIPFFLEDYTSLPLTVGVLTGLMWTPLSWMIQHWIGVFHATFRSAAIVIVWYLIPTQRFVAIPIVIVATYLFTIAVLEARWRRIHTAASAAGATA